uniref:Uncharacterized protein n=1 Tax=Anguilla anguilla TaxID=7936 RepID=A0A0E9V4E7_ANGAN
MVVCHKNQNNQISSTPQTQQQKK